MNDKIDIPDREPDFSVGPGHRIPALVERHFWFVEYPDKLVTRDKKTLECNEVYYNKDIDVLCIIIGGTVRHFIDDILEVYHEYVLNKEKEIEDILLDATEG